MTGASRAPDPDLRQAFLDGMSCAAWSVCVVTTDGPAGRRGVTVSAMTSVSADGPSPTLLVCIHRLSAAGVAIRSNGAFTVNLLSAGQRLVSERFAGRLAVRDDDRFAGASWTIGATGAPRLDGAVAAFDCRLATDSQVGTHHVLFGEVVEAAVLADAAPLIHHRRAYWTPAPLPSDEKADTG